MDGRRRTRELGGAAAAVGALWFALPPGEVVGGVRAVVDSPTRAVDVFGGEATVTVAVGAVAWGAAAWLALAVTMLAAGSLPGPVGAAARLASRAVAPAAVRRVLAGTLGLSLLTGVAPGVAHAAGPTAAARAGTVAADVITRRSVLAPAADVRSPSAGLLARPADRLPEPARPVAVPIARLDLDWPVARASARERPAAATSGTRPSAPVEVRAGDSLWRIAAGRLGPAPAAGEIAREWPRWWARNRAVIGPDPDLLHVGQRLAPPEPHPQ